jgi:hypothetical protein
MLIVEYKLQDGIIIQLYQGNRGSNTELDFQLKQLESGKTRARSPSHTHWIVDLIMKAEANKKKVGEFVDFLIEIYNNSSSFKTKEERENYKLKYGLIASKKFSDIKGGKYSVEYITTIIELFSICEKQFEKAYMFKKSLDLMKRYVNDQSDFYTVISHSKRV